MNEFTIKYLRMERQHLTKPIDSYQEYDKFFRLMQPVSPIYFSRPGEAPSLVFRTTFDDKMYNDKLRSNRKILKGRFQGGNIGYVFQDELALYAACYKKEIEYLDDLESYIYRLLTEEGPLNIQQIKEISGLLVKEITPTLHKLSKAFLVFEDQVDDDWERGWYIFQNELDINLKKYRKEDAIKELIRRAIYLLVYASFDQLKSWLKLTNKDIKNAIESLIYDKVIIQEQYGDKIGYLLTNDISMLGSEKILNQSVFMLHRSDFLVRANEHMLKEKFKGYEILQYLLIDGEFQGAVCGHWRIGPHDVEDIILTIPIDRKEEILSAVSICYSPPFSNILKYNGELLNT